MAKVNKSTHPASDVHGAGTPRRLPTGARSTASATRPTALQPTSARGWAARKKLHDREHNNLKWPGRQPRREAITPEGRDPRHSSSVRRGVAMHPWWHHQRQPREESTAVQTAHSSLTIRGRKRPVPGQVARKPHDLGDRVGFQNAAHAADQGRSQPPQARHDRRRVAAVAISSASSSPTSASPRGWPPTTPPARSPATTPSCTWPSATNPAAGSTRRR